MTQNCLQIVDWLKNWFTSTEDLLDKTYPVGSIYMSVNSTSPSTLFGGTWEQIEDKFLLASGNTYANGSSGGEATHSLTQSEMPRHNHALKERGMVFGIQTSTAETTNGFSSGTMFQNSNKKRSDIAFTGGSGTSQSASNGSAHNNMPPYLTVNVWKRTA